MAKEVKEEQVTQLANDNYLYLHPRESLAMVLVSLFLIQPIFIH